MLMLNCIWTLYGAQIMRTRLIEIIRSEHENYLFIDNNLIRQLNGNSGIEIVVRQHNLCAIKYIKY